MQIVARGELFAIPRPAQLAEEGSAFEFVIDRQGNFNKFSAGRETALLSNDRDIFKVLFGAEVNRFSFFNHLL